MTWSREYFGELDGRPVEQFALQNEAHFCMKLLTYGATLRSFVLPNGLDVCLGYDTLDAYRMQDGYLGAIIGRNSNRIAGAAFTLHDRHYTLEPNEGKNQLHGGRGGFDTRLWTAEPQEGAVRFTRVSPDGEEGFPGTVRVAVTYALRRDGFSIEYEAVSDRDTVVNLTNHSYFNLAGQGNGTILDHMLAMPAASFYLPVDGERIPTGAIASVEGTAMDFRTAHAVGARIDAPLLAGAGGYDHAIALDGDGMRCAAVLSCPRSGVTMTLTTNMENMQLYTGNGLSARDGKHGARYGKYSGLCLETQRYPNAVNEPAFPSMVLHAGERYLHRAVFCFEL